ncbi:MAG: right-handed parallel beta-helix repeat-containing protein [Lentisphaerae bacterium]|nr:right-handed parallel beta-helix repeat-containing protein [Lentisphaerota bacterium]
MALWNHPLQGIVMATGLATALATVAAAAELTLAVAPDGDDAAAGTAAAPFRTLQRARDAVRRLKAESGLPDGGVRILLRGGVHTLAETLILTPEDSGTAAAPITWAAYPGERPVVSGGRVIAGLQRGADGVWSTTIPAARDHAWVFRQLFINGRRYLYARSPNAGQYAVANGVMEADGKTIARDRFAFERQDLQAWPDPADVELRLYFSWNTGTFPLKSVDPATRIAELGGPAVWSIPKPGMSTCPYVVYNHPGACDAPGEWQLDRRTGELRVIPFDNEDLAAATVVAPFLERLVEATGEPEAGRLVEHIGFEGIAFHHAAWRLPPEGFSTPQAANTLGAALEFRGARHCAFTACEVAHVGRYGIWFATDCSDNTIRQCHLHDLGGGGIRLGTTDRPTPYERMAHHNTIDNCFIHDGGHTNPGATGIFMGYGRQNTISHNEVADLRYTGISLGWTWDTIPSGTRENIVEFNHVHHVMRVLEDGGGIYSLGLTPGSIIRNNVIHNVGTPPDAIGHGIYLDGGSAGVLCENNLCYDCGHGGIRIQHGTSALTIINNISAFCGFGLGIDSERTNVVQNNIVLLDGDATPFRYVKEWQSYDKIIDYNLYWHAGGKALKFLDFTFAEWQKKEGLKDIWYTPRMDAHSRVADPKFVDAAARDFRLQPDSPALALGFRPIDPAAAGLYGDPAWTALPQSHPPRPLLPNETALGLRLVTDDFEDTPVGAKPAYAALVEAPEAGAVITVSDERASGGRHSLKFTDTAEAPIYYHPHLYYTPRLVGDLRVTVSFDLYREPGAMLWTEWRHTPSYAKVGPCLYIEADGQILLQGKRPANCVLPDSTWLHVEMSDALGSLADGLWKLRILDEKGTVLFEQDDLPCDPEFSRVLWLGFVAHGTAPAIFYLDNLTMTLDE